MPLVENEGLKLMVRALRILHVAPGEPFGGIQKLVVELAAHQLKNGLEVSVLWTGAADRASAICQQYGVRTNVASGGFLQRFFRARSALRHQSADILHLHMPPPWIALLLPTLSGAKCVHLHGKVVARDTLQARVTSHFEKRIVRQADILVAISSWIQTVWLAKYPTADIVRVFNGVPVPADIRMQPARAKRDFPIIGFASRLAADKGVSEFIEFVVEMNKIMPNVRFLVAGDGPERPAIERRLEFLVRDGTVRLLGHIDDMSLFWRQLDLSVFCAKDEPFGLRLIEPVVHGTPVIGYRTGAGSDEVADLCAGIATVPYDDAAGLAALGAELLTDTARRTMMSGAGFQDAQVHFSINAMTDALEGVYCKTWTRRAQRT